MGNYDEQKNIVYLIGKAIFENKKVYFTPECFKRLKNYFHEVLNVAERTGKPVKNNIIRLIGLEIQPKLIIEVCEYENLCYGKFYLLTKFQPGKVNFIDFDSTVGSITFH